MKHISTCSRGIVLPYFVLIALVFADSTCEDSLLRRHCSAQQTESTCLQSLDLRDETPCIWCGGEDCGQSRKCESVNQIATLMFEGRASDAEMTAACDANVPVNLRCADHPHTPGSFILGQRHKHVCKLTEGTIWYECKITDARFSMREPERVEGDPCEDWIVPRDRTVFLLNDGSVLSVIYDAEVSNREQGLFDCSSRFVEATVASFGESSNCAWSSANELRVYLGYLPALVPGSFLQFHDVEGYSGIETLDNAATPSASVDASIEGPAQVGSCGVATFRVVSETGGMGRNLFYTWSASVEIDQNCLTDSIHSSSLELATSCFTDIIAAETKSTITLEACNFAGQCSTSHKTVVKMSSPLPLVSVLGRDVSLNVDSGSTFSIHLDVPMSECGFDASNLSYEWRTLLEMQLPSLQDSFKDQMPDEVPYGVSDLSPSNSMDPIIMANQLLPSHNYAWEVQVSDSNGAVNFAYVGISTAPLAPKRLALRKIIAVANEEMSVDVEDLFDLQGIDAASLSYSWTIAPSIALTNANSRTVSLTPTTGGDYRLSLTFAGKSSYVDIQAGSANSAISKMSAEMNPSDRLVVSSSASKFDQVMSGSYVRGLQLSIDGCASWESEGCVKVDPGSEVTFVTEDGAMATVGTNEPPSGGMCSVTPLSGVEMETQFTVKCEGWADMNLPLSYSFELLPAYLHREGQGTSCSRAGLTASTFEEATDLGIAHGISVFSRDLDTGEMYICQYSDIVPNPIDNRYLETGIAVDINLGGIFLRTSGRSNQIQFQSARGAHYVRAFISDALGAVTQFSMTISASPGTSNVASPLPDLNSLSKQVGAGILRMSLTQRNSYMDTLSSILSSFQRRSLEARPATSAELVQIAGIAYTLVKDSMNVDRAKIFMMAQLLDTVVSLSSSSPESRTMDMILRAVESLTAASIFGEGESQNPLRDAELLHSVVTNVAYAMVAGKLLGEDGFSFLNENLTVVASKQDTNEIGITNCGAGVFHIGNVTDAIPQSSVSCVFIEQNDMSTEAVTGMLTQTNLVSLEFGGVDFSVIDLCEPIMFTLENSPDRPIVEVYNQEDYDYTENGESFNVAKCEHFDFTTGSWVDTNCKTIYYNTTMTTCSCTSASTFSVNIREITPEMDTDDYEEDRKFKFSDFSEYKTAWAAVAAANMFAFIFTLGDKFKIDYPLLAYKNIWDYDLANSKYHTSFDGSMIQAFNKKQSSWLKFMMLLKIRLCNEHPVFAPFLRDDYTNSTGMQRAMLLLVAMMSCMVIPAIFYGTVSDTAPNEVTVIFVTGLYATVPVLILAYMFQYSKPAMVDDGKIDRSQNWNELGKESEDPSARADDALMERQAKVLNCHSAAFLFLKYCHIKPDPEAVAGGFDKDDGSRDFMLQRSRKELASYQVVMKTLGEYYEEFKSEAEHILRNFDISDEALLRPDEVDTVVRWFHKQIFFDDKEVDDKVLDMEKEKLLSSVDLLRPGEMSLIEFQAWFILMYKHYGNFWDLHDRQLLRNLAHELFAEFDLDQSGDLDLAEIALIIDRTKEVMGIDDVTGGFMQDLTTLINDKGELSLENFGDWFIRTSCLNRLCNSPSLKYDLVNGSNEQMLKYAEMVVIGAHVRFGNSDATVSGLQVKPPEHETIEDNEDERIRDYLLEIEMEDGEVQMVDICDCELIKSQMDEFLSEAYADPFSDSEESFEVVSQLFDTGSFLVTHDERFAQVKEWFGDSDTVQIIFESEDRRGERQLGYLTKQQQAKSTKVFTGAESGWEVRVRTPLDFGSLGGDDKMDQSWKDGVTTGIDRDLGYTVSVNGGEPLVYKEMRFTKLCISVSRPGMVYTISEAQRFVSIRSLYHSRSEEIGLLTPQCMFQIKFFVGKCARLEQPLSGWIEFSEQTEDGIVQVLDCLRLSDIEMPPEELLSDTDSPLESDENQSCFGKRFRIAITAAYVYTSWKKSSQCLCALSIETVVTAVMEHDGWLLINFPVEGWVSMKNSRDIDAVEPYQEDTEAGGTHIKESEDAGVPQKKRHIQNKRVEMSDEEFYEGMQNRHKRAPSLSSHEGDVETGGESDEEIVVSGNDELNEMFRSRKRWWVDKNNVFDPGELKFLESADADDSDPEPPMFGQEGHRKLLEVMRAQREILKSDEVDKDKINLAAVNEILNPGKAIIDSMRKKTKVQSAEGADRHIYLHDTRSTRLIADVETERQLNKQQEILLNRHYPLRPCWRIVGWVFLLIYVALCDILVIYYGLQWNLDYSYSIQASTLDMWHTAEEACPSNPEIIYDWSDSFEFSIQNRTKTTKYNDKDVEIENSSLRKTFGDGINDAEKFVISFLFSLLLSWFLFHPLIISVVVWYSDFYGGQYLWFKHISRETPTDFVQRLMDLHGAKPLFTMHQLLHHPHFVYRAMQTWDAHWKERERQRIEHERMLADLTSPEPTTSQTSKRDPSSCIS